VTRLGQLPATDATVRLWVHPSGVALRSPSLGELTSIAIGQLVEAGEAPSADTAKTAS